MVKHRWLQYHISLFLYKSRTDLLSPSPHPVLRPSHLRGVVFLFEVEGVGLSETFVLDRDCKVHRSHIGTVGVTPYLQKVLGKDCGCKLTSLQVTGPTVQ